jgi:hypothetical protein
MRTRAASAFVSAVAAAAFAAPASAATVIGETPGAGDTKYECSPMEGTQTASGPGASSYTVPIDGVISSFRHLGAPAPLADQRVRLKVWQPAAEPVQFKVVGASDIESVEPGALNDYEARVPVSAGDMLGLATLTSSMQCAFDGVAGDQGSWTDRQDTLVNSSAYLPIPANGFRFNIEATVEPDADGDAFGDESQDGCPEMGDFHGPCPPDTELISPPKTVRGAATRFRFRSTLPRSRFTCKMDNRRARPCSSPIVYRDLKKTRKHRFAVYATIDGPASDPTPAKVKLGAGR